MRAKIMLVSGSEAALGLSLYVQEILTDLAVAFGHSFVMAEEKFSGLSMQEYGAAMTEETIEAAAECDALLCLSGDEEGLAELADGLGCVLRCHVFHLPKIMGVHSLLASGLLPDGTICYPISENEGALKKSAESYFKRLKELTYPVCEIPFAGDKKELWEKCIHSAAVRHFSQQDLQLTNTAELIKDCVVRPQSLGGVIATPAACASISAAASALCGRAASFLYNSYWDELGPKVYFSRTQASSPADKLNPFGALFAACDMLKSSLGLSQEAEFLMTCCSNVLDAGWRTADIAENGNAGVSSQAIVRLISDQIELAAALSRR